MITLTPETEAHLGAVAAQRGVSAAQALRDLIAEAAETADAVADLHRGTAEIAAGDWVSLEDLRRDMGAHARP